MHITKEAMLRHCESAGFGELLEVSNMHAQQLLIGVVQTLLHCRYGCEVETTHSLIIQYILNVY
jgi:hypothetical protein